MIFLTGLLGMMVIGSFAFLNVDSDDEEADDTGQEEFDPSANAQAEDPEGGDMLADDESLTPPPDPDPQSNGSEDPAPATVAPTAPEADTTPDPDDVFAGLLDGTAADDLIFGTDTDDVVRGYDGSDTLDGGEGDDTIEGQDGPDDLYGGLGNDSLSGGTGNDTMNGGEGTDMMRGGTGDDAMHGRDGADTLIGDRGQDTLLGADGKDLISGVRLDGDGEDIDQRDYLNGGNGDDTIIAGEDDVVMLGNGADVLVLGEWMTDAGAEVLDYDDEEDQLMVVYNDLIHGDAPELDLRPSADNPSMTEILLGDEVLATLPTEDAPDLTNVVLIAESTLDDLGLDAAAARHAG